MDTAIKELQKLQKLTEFEPAKLKTTISVLSAASLANKSKVTTGVVDSLDGLLASLRDVKERLEAGSASEDDILAISTTIEERKKEIDDRQKEAYATLGRIGKALDKVSCYFDNDRVAILIWYIENITTCARTTAVVCFC